MKHKDFDALMERTFAEIWKIRKTKGVEYAVSDEDMLANFKESGKEVGVLPITALYFALNKHMRSITTFIQDKQKGKTREYSESISGRIRDAQLYLILLEALIEDDDSEPV
jgi:hypothetical protein